MVRLRSANSEERRIKFDDMIKGTIEMPENDEDIVLLKSDGIPPTISPTRWTTI